MSWPELPCCACVLQVPIRPITWSGDYAPYSVIGDVTWSNVDVHVDVSVDAPGVCVWVSVAHVCCGAVQEVCDVLLLQAVLCSWAAARVIAASLAACSCP